MVKPENPYEKGSLSWNLMEGDWSDLTVRQIAEVLDVTPGGVYSALKRIRYRTGYAVPHQNGNQGKVKVMRTTSKEHLE